MQRQIATFYLDKTCLGVDILLIKEIYRHSTISPIPDAPPHLKGLMNLRGRVITVIDLNVCLNRPQTEKKDARLLIFKTQEDILPYIHKGLLPKVDIGEDIAGFIIDRMDDVLTISDEDVFSPPPNLMEVAHDLIRGVIKLENRLVILLDVPSVMALVMEEAGN